MNKRLIVAVAGAVFFGIVAAVSVNRQLATAQAFRRTEPLVEELKSEVQYLKTDFKILSAGEVSERINLVSQDVRNVQLQLDDLNRQLAGLQQIISPTNASEILTVAKMKDEILARNAFEARFIKDFDEKWKTAEGKLDRTDDKVANIQAWIWGSLATLIVALCAASLFLLRRFTHVIRMLENPPSSGSQDQVAQQG
jgi:hypothetical protein